LPAPGEQNRPACSIALCQQRILPFRWHPGVNEADLQLQCYRKEAKVQLPKDQDSPLSDLGQELFQGQKRQRIFRSPFLVVKNHSPWRRTFEAR
jgi:hypothetical protein